MHAGLSADTVQGTLAGFSGCELSIIRRGRRSLVRKVAAGIADNVKLDGEIAKLQRLDRLAASTRLFSVPAIHNLGVLDDGRRFYEMDFVVGHMLDSHIHDMDPGEINRWADILSEVIGAFAGSPAGMPGETPGGPAFIADKLGETLAALRRDWSHTEQSSALLTEYEDLVEALPRGLAGGTASGTFCHGDLAFDNVMITRDNRLYLLDPLVNAYESFEWDVAKVLQSCYAGWHDIKAGNFILDFRDGPRLLLAFSPKLALFNRRFLASIGHIADRPAATLYLAVTMARIIKYARDDRRLAALLILTNRLLRQYVAGEELTHESVSAVCW